MPTESEITAALDAWKKDWSEGPPEQDERSAMKAALVAANDERCRERRECTHDWVDMSADGSIERCTKCGALCG